MKHCITLFAFLFGLMVTVTAQSPRTVLLEVTESTWDMNSAEVICAKESIKSSYPDEVAVITYHTDNVINGGDPLNNTTANNWADALGVNAFSRGLIDRVSYNGTSMISVSSDNWADTIAARLNRPSRGLVTLPELLFDPDTREIYARVQIDFSKDVIELADYRFFFYVARNGLVADQLVDTNATLCATISDTNDTAYGFSHQDVAINSPSGASGVDNIIPVEITNGDRFTRSFTYTVPGNISITDLKVVGFVASWGGSNNVTENYVINVAQGASFTAYDSSDEDDPNHPNNPDNPNSVNNPNYWPTGINEPVEMDDVVLYPNPMRELGILEFGVPNTQKVSVDVYTLDGRQVVQIYDQTLAAGKQKAAISGTNLSSGVYIVRIKGENFNRFARLVKE